MGDLPSSDIVDRLEMHRSWRDSHGELNDSPHEAAKEIAYLRRAVEVLNDANNSAFNQAMMNGADCQSLRAENAELKKSGAILLKDKHKEQKEAKLWFGKAQEWGGQRDELQRKLEEAVLINYKTFTDGMEAAAQICASLAETTYDDSDAFDAVLGCEAAIMGVVRSQRKEQTSIHGDS